MCENLHNDVDDSNFDALKVKLDLHPNLCHFYNLLDKGISTGSHEDLEEVYENMEKREHRQLRGKHQANARDSHKHWKFIEEAFETLNKNKYCSKILKIAALCRKLKIFFDFKHGSTYYLNPATSYNSKGIIYENGPICIGAKYLTDDEKKFEVFGVLAHELCHLAVYMAFMNRDFDPFPIGEVQQRYIEVIVQCKERKDSEWIVANVFESYAENPQDSEMIVTVPQMLMHYHENQEKLTELEEIFEELFKYSKEVVEPELDKALPMLKLLEEGDKSVKFKDLTEPMKTKILHSGIKFQGQDTSLFEIISKLISDNEMEVYKDDGIGPIEWKGDKNILKLCDLVDKNFEKFDRNELYINSEFDLSFIISEKMFCPIFARVRNAVKNVCFVSIAMTSPNYKVISSGTLTYIFEEVEKTFNTDRESIRKLLFDKFY